VYANKRTANLRSSIIGIAGVFASVCVIGRKLFFLESAAGVDYRADTQTNQVTNRCRHGLPFATVFPVRLISRGYL